MAGRGGRGPEDDPLRLTLRGLLQFMLARGREKSLASAPADLLPASIVCQVRACISYEKDIVRNLKLRENAQNGTGARIRALHGGLKGCEIGSWSAPPPAVRTPAPRGHVYVLYFLSENAGTARVEAHFIRAKALLGRFSAVSGVLPCRE